MQLERLELAQLRVFEQADFVFQPGMNLLVGVNGAGKSTVLDVLRVMLSQTLPKFTASKSRPIPFEESDIAVGQGALTAELRFNASGLSFRHLIHVPREAYSDDEIEKDREYTPAHHVDRQTRIKRRREQQQAYALLTRNELQPDGKDIPKQLKASVEQPVAVYFSSHRSYPVDRKPSQLSSAGGLTAAFADALSHRELNLREFAEWWLAQDALAGEIGAKAIGRLATLNEAVTNFLNDCTNLRAVREPQLTLVVDKDNTTLNIRQLSDGERSIIALVLDLARRLTQANPQLDDPLQEGQAVVLIDELDLHLHPGWQRTIVEKLTATFPNCQFIATTHSPQIIGEVSPDSLILIEDGSTYRPDQSLGMDSNWVLQYLMNAADRDPEVKQRLDHIDDLIEEEQYDEAAAGINQLREEIGDFSELVRLQTRLDRLQILGL